MTDETPSPPEPAAPKWSPLPSMQRRIVGVLIEKSKTTPGGYPMTLNALTTGCNQKSNRSPQMNLDSEEVEMALEELREKGATTEVQGDGRVNKYRHLMYDWLNVEKKELSVMAELLLRGEQTLGELRTRTSRMDAIASLDELKTLLESLRQKELVVYLTPEGRGQIVAHTLYTEREMDALKQRRQSGAAVEAAPPTPAPPAISVEQFEQLKKEVQELRQEVAELRKILE